ncbi:MAG: methionyl-tRNA formyltransferase [Methylocystis sp.]|nr:methionyl-tRNA formyltransferase [Methylocystis sp.]
MRVVFMGTPDFAAPLLETIVAKGHDVAAVYTRPPAPGGRRGCELRRSPVHELADRLAIAVLTPNSLKSAPAIEAFAALGAEVGVVAAYGLILPQAILDAPRFGCLNLHGSLLPRWRGAAPIQRAVMAGDTETGVMVMKMEAGLDTGPVALSARIPVGPDTTAGELQHELSLLGAELMSDALEALARGKLTFAPQAAEGVTYAQKIDKAECRIDWRRCAHDAHNLIRGLSPSPGAFFEADLGHGVERVKVLQTRLESGSGAPGAVLDDRGLVACGDGALRLVRVQRGGGAPMSVDEFLRGRKLAPGALLAA